MTEPREPSASSDNAALAITVLSRGATLQQERWEARGAKIVDVTSRGPSPWVRFSPFFPHGGVPIPLWPGRTAASVEGIWQGLKRFEHEDAVDPSAFDNTTMRGLKRTTRACGSAGVPRGRVLGHQAGADTAILLEYVDARRRLYLPAYRWVLEHRLEAEVDELRRLAAQGPVVLLDYATNGDVGDPSRPLSHAALVRRYLEGDWPEPGAERAKDTGG